MTRELLAMVTGFCALATAAVTMGLTISNRGKVQQIHVLVNSRLTEEIVGRARAEAALEAAGLPIPADEKAKQ